MTDTTCPSCDAPAPPGAARCGRCGYRFFEDAGRRPRPTRQHVLVAGALTAAVLLAAFLAAVLDNPPYRSVRQDGPARPTLSVLSDTPLSTRAAERAITERYLPIPDDDTADVHCSGRVAKPAHSVRRCAVVYPGGSRRAVVLLTTARGAEVLAER